MKTPPPIPMPVSPAGSTQGVSTESVAGPHEGASPRVFPCDSCGADLTFHVGAQSLKCAHCGHVKSLDIDADADLEERDFAETLNQLAERRSADRTREKGVKEVRCDSCGAAVRFTGSLTSGECAYCGVSLQLDSVHDAEDRVAVDGVLPFKINRESARGNLAEWVRSRWFAPNEFKKRGAQGRFNGIYLPYWTYDALTTNRYSGQRGQHYWVTVGSGKSRRTVRRTRWYPASGTFQRFFDDVLVVAATGVPTDRLVALEPWPLNQCVPFEGELLAGFLARTYDIPLDNGFVHAKSRMKDAIEVETCQRIGGDAQRISSIRTRHEAVTYKHLLLPVWMLAYRYGQKSYQVVVNAGTGEVQGDRPYSWIKITLAALAASAAAALIGVMLARGG